MLAGLSCLSSSAMDTIRTEQRQWRVFGRARGLLLGMPVLLGIYSDVSVDWSTLSTWLKGPCSLKQISNSAGRGANCELAGRHPEGVSVPGAHLLRLGLRSRRVTRGLMAPRKPYVYTHVCVSMCLHIYIYIYIHGHIFIYIYIWCPPPPKC